jgi:hypothetical protein
LLLAGDIPSQVNEEDIEKELSVTLYKHELSTYLLNFLGIYNELKDQYNYCYSIMVNTIITKYFILMLKIVNLLYL